MIQTALQKKWNYTILTVTHKNLGILIAIFLSIIGLTVFQDFLEANRNDYSFYFSESILFKTIWFLFIPFLAILSSVVKKQKLNSIRTTVLFIIVPIGLHLIVLSFVFLFFSFLFFNGTYSMHKIVTYTLANDFYKIIIVYSGFIFLHRYLYYQSPEIVSVDQKTHLKKLKIGNGKNNTIVEVKDIFQISAETPYIFIQLEEKKYLHTETLKSITTKLDNNTFIRVHKSTIVNLDKVISFQSRLNGDYNIYLKNGVKVRLSRTYAANFKRHFRNTPRVTV